MINEIVFRKAVAGDGNSFYELLKPIKNSLYKVALAYTGNEYDALDCVHESIVKAIKSLSNLKEPQYFNTWIMRITINICKDYINKSSKVVLLDIKDYEDLIPAEEKNNEYSEDILTALSKLREEERDLIVLRYIEDMSLKDISQNTQVPLGTIKSKISRTLKKLRIYMEEVRV